MAKFRVSPSAGGYLRRYGLLPSQVTATGPKGHLLKGDVLQYAQDNKVKAIDLRQTSQAEAPAQKTAPAAKSAPKA